MMLMLMVNMDLEILFLNRAWEHKLFTSTKLLGEGTSNRKYRTTTETKSLL